jgi:hypothetical protein
MADTWTKLNLDDVEDAAIANGFGDRWEARVAHRDLGAEPTRLTLLSRHTPTPPGWPARCSRC